MVLDRSKQNTVNTENRATIYGIPWYNPRPEKFITTEFWVYKPHGPLEIQEYTAVFHGISLVLQTSIATEKLLNTSLAKQTKRFIIHTF